MASAKRGLGRLASAGFAATPDVASRMGSIVAQSDTTLKTDSFPGETSQATDEPIRSLITETTPSVRMELLVACESRFTLLLDDARKEYETRLEAFQKDISTLIGDRQSTFESVFLSAVEQERAQREASIIELQSHIESAQAVAESAQAAVTALASRSSENIGERHLSALFAEERQNLDLRLDELRKGILDQLSEQRLTLEPVSGTTMRKESNEREASIIELKRHIASAQAVIESGTSNSERGVSEGRVAELLAEERRERDSSLIILRNDLEARIGSQIAFQPALSAALQAERAAREVAITGLQSEIVAALGMAEGVVATTTATQNLKFSVASSVAEVSSSDDLMDQVSRLELCIEEFRGDVASSALVVQQQFTQTDRRIKELQQKEKHVAERLGDMSKIGTGTSKCDLEALEGAVGNLTLALEEVKVGSAKALQQQLSTEKAIKELQERTKIVDAQTSSVFEAKQLSSTEGAIGESQEISKETKEIRFGKQDRVDSRVGDTHFQALEDAVGNLTIGLEDLRRAADKKAPREGQGLLMTSKLTRLQVLGALVCGSCEA